MPRMTQQKNIVAGGGRFRTPRGILFLVAVSAIGLASIQAFYVDTLILNRPIDLFTLTATIYKVSFVLALCYGLALNAIIRKWSLSIDSLTKSNPLAGNNRICPNTIQGQFIKGLLASLLFYVVCLAYLNLNFLFFLAIIALSFSIFLCALYWLERLLSKKFPSSSVFPHRLCLALRFFLLGATLLLNYTVNVFTSISLIVEGELSMGEGIAALFLSSLVLLYLAFTLSLWNKQKKTIAQRQPCQSAPNSQAHE